MATPIEIVSQAYESLRQQADAQQKLNDAGRQFLQQFGPVAPQDLARVTEQMKKLQAQGLEKFASGLDKTKAALAGVQLGVTGSYNALLKMQHAASPQLVGAISTQLETIQAKMGKSLVGVTSRLSSALDDLSEGFSSLSETQQTVIAASVVAAPVVGMVARSIASLMPAATKAQIGLKALVASLGPLGALSAIVGTVAVGSATGDNERKINSETAAKSGAVTMEEIRAADARWNIFRGSRNEAMSADATNQQQRYGMKLTIRQLQDESQERGAFESKENYDARRAAATSVITRLQSHGFVSEAESDRQHRIHSLQKQIGTASREMQPHYSGLGDIHKQLQMAMLVKNPYEQELLKIQRETLKVLRQQLADQLKQGSVKPTRLVPD